MNDNSEVITLEVDPEPAIRGAAAGNAAMDAYSKKAEAGVRTASRAFTDHGDVVVRTSDRSRTSLERLTAAWEKQAQAYGKTGMERIIAQRDQLIQRLGNEEKAIERVRVAAERMMQAERQLESGGGSGFRTTFAIKGVKDVFEGRGTFAIAEGVNELMSLRGTALMIGGITAALGGAVFAAYEFKNGLREIHDAAERASGAFNRFGDEQKLANLEAKVTNDKLENAIAKLEHRPQNNLKLAIDEAAVSAGHLAEKLDKSLKAFGEIVKANAPGTFAALWAGGNNKDIQELVEGKSGFGGLRGDLYSVTRNGGDPSSVLASYRQSAQGLLSTATRDFTEAKRYQGALGSEVVTTKQGRLETVQALMRQIDDLQTAYGIESRTPGLQARKDALDKTAGYGDRVTELEKRSRETYGAAYFGEQTAYGKYLGAASKIELERADFQRLNPGYSGRVNAAYDEQKAAAWLKFLDESSKALERFSLELDASGDEVSKSFPNAMKKRLTDSDTALRSAGITDQHGNLHPSLFGDIRPVAPSGYVSPEQQLRDVSRSEQRFAGLYGLQASIGATSPFAQIGGMYGGRKQFAELEYQAQIRVNNARLSGAELELANLAAVDNRKQKLFEAELERDAKLLEIEKQRFDEIKQTAAGLFNTLFTHPGQFGGQLLGTVKSAALRPITEGLGNLTAKFLYPMLYGGGPDVKLSSAGDHLHNAASALIGAAQSLQGGGGYAGGGAYDGGYSPVGGGFSGGASPLGYAGMLGPGGTSGFTGALGGFGGGARGSFGGLGGILGSIRSMNWGGLKRVDPHSGESVGSGGRITGVGGLMGAGLMFGGTALAQAGLLGGARGTAGGTLEGLLGGAAVGFAMGGPLGAGIGAAAGGLIGIGEMIAGVEPPSRQAHRLIAQIYHLDIPEKSGTMQQILQLAAQYGSVSGAVRSSQARQLIEMYALALGRSSDLFLGSPRSASLVQNGNTLYQGLSYFNGSGYNFASSLPTLGTSSGVIPTSNPYGGFMQLDGPATTALLTGQVARVTTPEYVGAQNVAALRSGPARFATMGAVLAPSTIFA